MYPPVYAPPVMYAPPVSMMAAGSHCVGKTADIYLDEYSAFGSCRNDDTASDDRFWAGDSDGASGTPRTIDMYQNHYRGATVTESARV